MKKINKYIIMIVAFLSFLIINCESSSPKNLGESLEINLTPNILEPSTDIIIECSNVNMFDFPYKYPDDLITSYGHDGEKDLEKLMQRYYNSKINLTQNIYNVEEEKFGYNISESKNLVENTDSGIGLIFKEKLSGNKARYTLKSNVTSTYEAKFFGHYGGMKIMNLKIKYPEILSYNKDSVKIGDDITITSSIPFFDESSFSKEKLNTLLNRSYYIVWISKSSEIIVDSATSNWNSEKEPVTKDYYLTDKITPYSITFKIPPFAKTGKVHIVNETGVEIQGNISDSIVVSKSNSFAYYATKSELTILDASGNVIK